jgi:hypothetical protein
MISGHPEAKGSRVCHLQFATVEKREFSKTLRQLGNATTARLTLDIGEVTNNCVSRGGAWLATRICRTADPSSIVHLPVLHVEFQGQSKEVAGVGISKTVGGGEMTMIS